MVFNIDNTFVAKLNERKTNAEYLIGYLDKVIRALDFILSKMIGYIKDI